MKDIYILGINPVIEHFPSHDPSACLLHNGKIIAAVEEERFIRVKHAERRFPINAIKYCLDYGGITLDDLTSISISGSPEMCGTRFTRNLKPGAMRLTGNLIGLYHSFDNFKKHGFKSRKKIANELKIDIYSRLKVLAENPSKTEIDFVSHHRAHAASTFYCSGFKKASVITMDGIGEPGLGETTVLWDGNNNQLVKIRNFLYPNSLGHYYELFCLFLGFTRLEGPGKVMGLAPYGKESSDITQIFERKLRTKNLYDVTNFMSRIQIQRAFGKPRNKDAALTPKSRNIAFMLQKKLEEMAINLVNENYGITSSKNLCLAGGVAMNCVMNGKLLKSENVNNIFVQPGAGDLGTSIGAALETYRKLGYNPHTEFKHNYLGPEFTNEQIESALKKFKNQIKYKFYKDIAGVTAELLAKNKLVGWFEGRMELGARALGSRSILANPTKPDTKDILNAKVKHREMWRPFCPSLLDRAHNEYIEDAYPSPYMIIAFDVKKEKQKEIPAVTHVDGTARTQTVTKETNPLYYKLIEGFEAETGVPVILNTSFNVAGEPIVLRPEEAINDLLNTGLDCLAIGNYLVTKK